MGELGKVVSLSMVWFVLPKSERDFAVEISPWGKR